MKLCSLRTGIAAGLTAASLSLIVALAAHFMREQLISLLTKLAEIGNSSNIAISLLVSFVQTFIMFFIIGFIFAFFYNLMLGKRSCDHCAHENK